MNSKRHILKMEALVSSETFVHIYHTTPHHIPKYSTLNKRDNCLETSQNAFPSLMFVYRLNILFITGVAQAA